MYGYEKFRDFLEDEGYRICDDGEKIFVFKHEGSHIFVFKNESPFVQVAIPIITDEADRNVLLELCNEMNDDRMVAKFVVRDDSVLCNFEFPMFDIIPKDFLQEIMPSLVNVTAEFSDMLAKLEQKED